MIGGNPPETVERQLHSTARVTLLPSYAVVLGAAVVLGTVLRLYQITRQVILDDEWHALLAAVNQGYGYLLTHFGVADYSIPLALADRFALDTLGLSEMSMRAPVLLLGLASLGVFPWLVRDLVGWPVASTFALLLAVSPLHVYFSRYARPYSASVFFSFVAAIAFYKWWSGGPRRWAHVYALSAGVGAWFHLTALPLALAPLVVSAGALIWKTGHYRPARQTAGVGLEMALVTMSFLAMPLWVDRAALSAKTGRVSVDFRTIAGAAQLMFGTRHGWLILALLAATGLGAAALVRTRRTLLIYGLALSILHLVAVVLLRPSGVRIPIVFARYALPTLPWLLLLAAAGIVAVCEKVTPPHGSAAVLFLAVVTAILLVGGPLPAIYHRPNNWTNHAMFQYLYDPTNAYNRRYRLPPPDINPFYRRLANQTPASLTLLEAPWFFESGSNVYPFYQQVHRQWMIVGFVRPDAADETAPSLAPELRPAHRTHFRTFLHVGSHAEIAARGVDYVIFHKDLGAELPMAMRRQPSESVTAWIDDYHSVYGLPVYEDTAITVFEVKRALRPPRRSGQDEPAAAESAPAA